MSTVAEIRDTLKQLPVQEAQDVAQWLRKYLEHQSDTEPASANRTKLSQPDYCPNAFNRNGYFDFPNSLSHSR